MHARSATTRCAHSILHMGVYVARLGGVKHQDLTLRAPLAVQGQTNYRIRECHVGVCDDDASEYCWSVGDLGAYQRCYDATRKEKHVCPAIPPQKADDIAASPRPEAFSRCRGEKCPKAPNTLAVQH